MIFRCYATDWRRLNILPNQIWPWQCRLIKWRLIVLEFFVVIFLWSDLKAISDRLKNRYYIHRHLFIADMTRLFTNCRSFNEPDTDYYKCANVLEKFFHAKMREAKLMDKWQSCDCVYLCTIHVCLSRVYSVLCDCHHVLCHQLEMMMLEDSRRHYILLHNSICKLRMALLSRGACDLVIGCSCSIVTYTSLHTWCNEEAVLHPAMFQLSAGLTLNPVLN